MKTESLPDRMNADSAESIPKDLINPIKTRLLLAKKLLPYAKLAILRLVKTESFQREVKLIQETKYPIKGSTEYKLRAVKDVENFY